jgi:FixJ family two-component response regulator
MIAAPPLTSDGTSMSSFASAIIAVVDDDCRVLESLENLLSAGGYTARVFLSARAFLDSGTLPSISCLISDIRMPVMDGWELRAAANLQRPELPVILITGHDDVLPSNAGRGAAIFRKPFSSDALLAAVDAALAH